MKEECKDIQKIVNRNPSLMEGFEKHGHECPECRRFFENLRLLLDKLPRIELDAPDSLVELAFQESIKAPPKKHIESIGF